MARGGRGGGRGGNRGRSFAQSGGKSSSWADTKKGAGSQAGMGGGSGGQSVKGRGKLSSGSNYKVRGPGGDATLGRQGVSVKRGAPNSISGNPKPTPSNGQGQYVQPTVRKDIYGRGGSRG